MVSPELPGRPGVLRRGLRQTSGIEVGMQAVRALPRWGPRGAVISSALTVTALVIWAICLPAIDPLQATDLGLVAVLPAPFFLALGLVVVAFMVALNERPLRTGALLFSVLAIVVMTHGLRAVVADGTHLATAWVHVGFADVISRTGGVLPDVDARFSWPVFFALTAFVEEAAALDLREIIPWVPLTVNVLLLPCLILIYRTFSSDMRVAWVACFVFFATSWIGQDYLSPQAFAFILYLSALGVVLTWFARVRGARATAPVRAADDIVEADPFVSPGARRAGLIAIVIVLVAALVPSHQLTPFALLGALSALVVFRMTWLVALPILVAVMLGAWISYMTVPFLAGHIGGLLAQVGSTEAVTTENVTARVRGSVEHMVVIYIRLAATMAIWLLAGLGLLSRIRHRRWDGSAILLAGAPIALFFLQSYGGEMLQRIYLFSLPFIAFFVAVLFVPRPTPIARFANLTLAATLAVMLIALTYTRFGNERIDLIASGELEGVSALHDMAPSGSTIVSVNNNSPLRLRDIDQYTFRAVGFEASVGDVDAIVAVLEESERPSFLVLTRAQQAWAEVMDGMPPGEWKALATELAARPELEVAYRNSDTVVFQLMAPGDGTGD